MEDVVTGAAAPRQSCLSCGSGDLAPVISLGCMPLANAYPHAAATDPEKRLPLDVGFCRTCSLIQLRHVVPPAELFSEYLYFSSYSASMLRHAEALATSVIADRALTSGSLVVEIASNDGYLLQYFKRAGIPVLGVEPAANIAQVAWEERGIPTVPLFFGRDAGEQLAGEGRHADVVLGLNVLAHVPDPAGFIAGIASMLKPDGVAIFEVPYVRDMVEHVEFDTIYHEHLSYFSLHAITELVSRQGLVVHRVERVPIHGGSLRVTIGRGAAHGPSVRQLLDDERKLGLLDEAYYATFRAAVERVRADLVDAVVRLRTEGATVAAYGAAAKGTVFLNYCGLDSRSIDFVADRNPHKQGRRMPGCGIPIVDPDAIARMRPDYLLLLVWNLKDEVLQQETRYRSAGGRFIVAVPRLQIL
jgi:SAM-dependent methyltransferase